MYSTLDELDTKNSGAEVCLVGHIACAYYPCLVARTFPKHSYQCRYSCADAIETSCKACGKGVRNCNSPQAGELLSCWIFQLDRIPFIVAWPFI